MLASSAVSTTSSPPFAASQLLAVSHLQPTEALQMLHTMPHSLRPVVWNAAIWLLVPLPAPKPQQAWVLMGLPLATLGSRAGLERAQRVLPFVTDPAGMALAPIFHRKQPWKGSIVSAPAAFQGRHQQVMELFENLGHEFRTPLATIKGYTDSLVRRLSQLTVEECQDFLQEIRQAENRLEMLTSRLLEAAQLEAGVVQLEFQALDLPSLVQGTMRTAQQWVPDSLRENMTFHLHVRDADGQPAQQMTPIRGHPSTLSNVFEHLLENAIRFSPQGDALM